jgi:hypothetical protein
MDMMRVASSAKFPDAQVGYFIGWKQSGSPFEQILDPCVIFKRDFSDPSLLKHTTPNG